MTPPLIEIRQVEKAYPALRPLRLKHLAVAATDRLVLRGFDEGAAEMFVHLVTGASVPDEGAVLVDGKDTREIATDTEWLTSLDRFGIVTHRAVLIDKLTLAANLALPLTVAIEPIPPDIRATVEQLANDAGFVGGALEKPVAELDAEDRLRLHLTRAVANGPALLLLEHPTAKLGNADASRRFGETLKRLTISRGCGWVALTEDEAFVAAAGGAILELSPATGELAAPMRGWRRWLP